MISKLTFNFCTDDIDIIAIRPRCPDKSDPITMPNRPTGHLRDIIVTAKSMSYLKREKKHISWKPALKIQMPQNLRTGVRKSIDSSKK